MDTGGWRWISDFYSHRPTKPAKYRCPPPLQCKFLVNGTHAIEASWTLKSSSADSRLEFESVVCKIYRGNIYINRIISQADKSSRMATKGPKINDTSRHFVCGGRTWKGREYWWPWQWSLTSAATRCVTIQSPSESAKCLALPSAVAVSVRWWFCIGYEWL